MFHMSEIKDVFHVSNKSGSYEGNQSESVSIGVK